MCSEISHSYVEILERQQKQLVRGIRAIYDRQLSAQPWTGPLRNKGYPRTHDILDYLGALEVESSSGDEACEVESPFEEDFEDLRRSIVKKENKCTQAPNATDSAPRATQAPHDQEPYQGHPSDNQVCGMGTPSTQTSITSPTIATSTEHWTTRDSPGSLPQHQTPFESLSKSPEPSERLPILCGTDCGGGSTRCIFDPYLFPPWEPDEELKAFAHAASMNQ